MENLYTRIEQRFDPKDREQVEKVFDVNLEDRSWSIMLHRGEVEITFFNKDAEGACFGWTDRKTLKEFFDRLYKNNFYLEL